MAQVKVYSPIGSPRNNFDKGEYISSSQFDTAFAVAEASEDTEITVSINSPGGSVADGYGMIATMKKSTKPVTAVIDGYGASMGYFIALGASKILAAKNAIIMVHSVQGGAAGSPDALREQADILDKLNETVATIMAERMGIPQEEVIAKYLDGADHWYTAQEALDLKLIDGITDYDAEIKKLPVAEMPYADFVAAFTGKHEKSFLDKIKAIFSPKKIEAATAAIPLTENEEYNVGWLISCLQDTYDQLDNITDSTSNPDLKTIADEAQKFVGAKIIAFSKLLYANDDDAQTDEGMSAKIKDLVASVKAEMASKVADEAIRTLDVDARVQVVAQERDQHKAELDTTKATLTQKENELQEANAKLAKRPVSEGVVIPGTGSAVKKDDPLQMDFQQELFKAVDQYKGKAKTTI